MHRANAPFYLFIYFNVLKTIITAIHARSSKGHKGSCGQNPKGREGVEAGRKELGGRGREITAHLCLATVLEVVTETKRQLKARDRSSTNPSVSPNHSCNAHFIQYLPGTNY